MPTFENSEVNITKSSISSIIISAITPSKVTNYSNGRSKSKDTTDSEVMEHLSLSYHFDRDGQNNSALVRRKRWDYEDKYEWEDDDDLLYEVSIYFAI